MNPRSLPLIQPDEHILVTGARGMAGRAIKSALISSGYGQSPQGGMIISPSREELDLLDVNAVNAWFKINQPTIVILAAATVGGIEANRLRPADFLLDNLIIETNVIKASWEHNVKRLLFLGSSCIYPKFAKQPLREESLLTGALEPTNECYAIAKITGIKLGEALRKQHGFDAISLMPTNLYGPGDNYHPTNSHLLPGLIRRFVEATENNHHSVTCWGTGNPSREFLHVEDLGSASVFALENWDPFAENAPKDDKGDPLPFLNVGTGIDLSIKQLAHKVAQAVGYSGLILWDTSKPDGTPKKQLDISRLKELGWTAKILFEEGLPKVINDFRSQRYSGYLRM